MDATIAIAVAVVAGLFSLASTTLQVMERLRGTRTTSQDSAAVRIDAKTDKYIERVEHQRDAAEERAEKLQTMLTELRGFYAGAVSRIEQLEQARERDAEKIIQLQSQLQGNPSA